MDTSEARRFYGDVKVGDIHLEAQFCEIQYDPYAPRDMQAVVHLLSHDALELYNQGHPIVIEGPGVTVSASQSVSVRLTESGWVVTSRINEILERMLGDDSTPASVYNFGYLFPLTPVTNTSSPTVQDERNGLFRGTREADGQRYVVPHEGAKVELDGVEIEVGSLFRFHEGGAPRFPEQRLVLQSVISFTIEESQGAQVATDRARALASTVLRMVNIIDRDRLRWVQERCAARDEDGSAVFQTRVLRQTPSPVETSSKIMWGSFSHTDLLKRMVTAYDSMSLKEREDIDAISDWFEIASTAQDIETSLVRWHSILEFVAKRDGYDDNSLYPKMRASASMRVTKLCTDLGVELDDLDDSATVMAIRGRLRGDESPNGVRDRFKFTEIRDQLLHEGFEVFDKHGRDVLRARKRARALAERVLLAKMGIDYKQTRLGQLNM